MGPWTPSRFFISSLATFILCYFLLNKKEKKINKRDLCKSTGYTGLCFLCKHLLFLQGLLIIQPFSWVSGRKFWWWQWETVLTRAVWCLSLCFKKVKVMESGPVHQNRTNGRSEKRKERNGMSERCRSLESAVQWAALSWTPRKGSQAGGAGGSPLHCCSSPSRTSRRELPAHSWQLPQHLYSCLVTAP